ncbi:MAG: sporulation protein YqfD [Clostridia bacterium]|nr:sporulation protein YqfD [Clostridia bacterium]
MSLAHWLPGSRTVSVPADRAADLLELCRGMMIPYSGFQASAERLTLTMTVPAVRRLRAAALRNDLPVEIGPLTGLPAVLGSARRRPGVCVGLALGILLLWLSGRYVWDIRIEGTGTLSHRDVKDTLAACGFTVGTPLRGFAADVIENRALIHDKRLAWISINRRGTVAYVQIREAAYPPVDRDRDTPANVVAARGGVVERVELTRGNLLTAAGQTVVPGQLLISGLYDSERVGFRWTHAEGRVYARTVREFRVEIPLSCEAAAPSLDGDRGISKEISLLFFGKPILFSKKTRNPPPVCDIIESEKVCTLIPGVGFPLSVRTVWYLPRKEDPGTVTLTRTPAEAQELAYLELSRQIGAVPGLELLSETVRPLLTEDAYILDVTVVCVEDIAEEKLFSVEPAPGD